MKRVLYLIIAVMAVLSCQKTEETGRLDCPAGFTAALDGTTVTLAWEAVPDAVSYIVYWNIEGEQSFSKSELLPSPGYVVEKVKTGVTYEFKVRAANNVAVSEFAGLKVVVPKPDEPEMPTAETPEISNIRPGLGWVNFTMKSYDGECTYEVYEGTAKIEDAVLEKTAEDAEAGTGEYSLGGLELDRDYTALTIKRLVEGYLDSEPATFDAFKTGNITVLTRNPSPCHLAFEWDDVAGNANWTFDTDIDPATRTYKIELAKDAAFTDVVYSFYSVNNWARDKSSGLYTYHANNWVGQSGSATDAAKPYANANTNIVFSQLEPSTTYWVRVRNAAGESVADAIAGDGSQIEMKARNGKSVWSVPVSATTQPAHVSSSEELLFQGFDDHAIQCDHINNASGMSPAGTGVSTSSTTSEYIYPWVKEDWGAFAPHSSVRYDNLGVSAEGAFPGNGETKLEGLAVYRMETDKIPSMKGWFCSKACYPCQGALKLGGSAGQKNYIVTPPFTELQTETQAVISCSAGAAHASSTPAKLHIRIYRAASKNVESVKTFDLPASAFVVSPNQDGYHNVVDMQTYSADVTLAQGDYVMFVAETIKSPATNRLIIDNILIKKK